MKTVRTFKGMMATCSRDTGTSISIENGMVYKGSCITRPTVGLRFICGTLSTNVVSEIFELNEDSTRGKFRTLSGSIYRFKIIEEGSVGELHTYDISENVRKLIEKINEKGNNNL
tara:strand:+ start:452 stop:796 length:345 start_codon:yes stop_codon:yes gene_type:complete